MSFNKAVQDHLFTLENSLNGLKNAKDLLVFGLNIKNMEKIILVLRKKYFSENLFDNYIKKEIFSCILFFLPKIYIRMNRLVCKNWHMILTSDFIKNVFGPFNEPYNMKLLKCGWEEDVRLKKIGDKICCYETCSGDINIMENNSVIKTYNFGDIFLDVFGNSETIYYYNRRMVIYNSEGKVITKPNVGRICDITMDEKYMYILGENKISKYNIEGKFIKKWKIASYGSYAKIITDKDDIYIWDESNNCIKVYSKNGDLISEIGRGDLGKKTKFDVYKDHMYIVDVDNQLIKVFSKNGELVFKENFECKICYNLFVINDKLYIDRGLIYVFKLKFY